jgi:MFS transporter, SP family, solute carrier family 2 (myo-inositol transporter), member 13
LTLVDRRGRKFLLTVGTSGIIISMTIVGFLFLRTEKGKRDVHEQLQARVAPDQTLTLQFDPKEARNLLGADDASAAREALTVIYAYGDFTAATNVARSDDPGSPPIRITRASAVPENRVEAFFKNPFADLAAAKTAPLRIVKAPVIAVPGAGNGWLVACFLYIFMAFYAIGPGVCVWLALSELMPTRIRSNGMSIALVINQVVSTTLAAIFLPVVGNYGYSTMFFVFAAFTVIYFVTAVFFLPETKGKTLEEIEEHFEGVHA